jgi:hypothetical protein
MKLSAPRMYTFLIAVLVAVVGLILQLASVGPAGLGFWLVVIGFVILAIGNLLEGI